MNHTICVELGQNVRVKEFKLEKDIIGKFTQENNGYYCRFTISDLLKKMLCSVTNTVSELYFFPASRSGLYKGMQSFIPIFAELSQFRAEVTRKIELPSLSEPHADYIVQLSQIQPIPTKNKGLKEVVDFLEGKILGGEIGFDTDKKDLTYSPDKSRLVLDMNVVSSMVSELSPFVAFIKYVLKGSVDEPGGVPHPIIFMEEPEAHLHPEVQVLLAEMFVKLANAGVKVVLTSHSNYLFYKFSNMLIAGTLEPEKFAPIVLKSTPKGSVSQLMEADDLGIEDENFIDTADSLYEERELILEKMNQEADDQ